LLRFWKRMDSKGLSIWGRGRRRRNTNTWSIMRSATIIIMGGEKKFPLLRRQNASAKWQERADRADGTASSSSSSSSSRNPNC
jgi:hypothetical protein